MKVAKNTLMSAIVIVVAVIPRLHHQPVHASASHQTVRFESSSRDVDVSFIRKFQKLRLLRVEHQKTHVVPKSPVVPGCSDAHIRESLTPDEIWIIDQEDTTWNPLLWNPIETSTGHAFGLGQLTDEIRAEYAPKAGVPANTTDPCQQIELMRAYIKGRYGTAAHAVAWHKVWGWY